MDLDKMVAEAQEQLRVELNNSVEAHLAEMAKNAMAAKIRLGLVSDDPETAAMIERHEELHRMYRAVQPRKQPMNFVC